MYNIFGSNIYTISETKLLEELEKVAVEEIIAKPVNYSTKFSEEIPVQLTQVHRSTAHSKSKKIVVKHPALSKSKKIAVKQPPDHSSPAKLKLPALAQPQLTKYKKNQSEIQKVKKIQKLQTISQDAQPRTTKCPKTMIVPSFSSIVS